MNVIQFPRPPHVECGYGVRLGGPYQDGSYRVEVNAKHGQPGEGRWLRLPHVVVMPGTDIINDFKTSPNENLLDVVVDGRLVHSIPRAGAGSVLSLLANAMAVAAGRSCFGGPPVDPWNVAVSQYHPEAPQ